MTHADMADDNAIHDRNVRLVSEIVFSLVSRFADWRMTSIAALEGAVKGGALAMALNDGDTPAAIADALEDLAAGIRGLPDDAFKKRPN